MVDFLKLVTYEISQIEYFRSHPLLNWVSDTDHINNFNQEVITTKITKEYKGIYFNFYAKKLEILFKPHYYFNNNLHNANDLTVTDCIITIKEARDTLKMDLQLFRVVNIEYGINCLSPINIKDLIVYLTYHEKNAFTTDTEYQFSKKSFSAATNGRVNQYKIIKAYAKGVQFPEHTDTNTFRFEVKSKKSRFIRQLGIYTANDLLNVSVYMAMAKSIINEFEKVLILDCGTDFTSLTQKEQNKIAKYNNPMEWNKILYLPNRNSFSKHKKTYHKLIDMVPNNLKNQLHQIIYDKIEILKKGAISPIINIGICTLLEKDNTQVKRVCKVTGINIEMQKEKSGLLSHTGLKYYYQTDRKIFEQIKRRYMSKKWFSADAETQIKEIAHNIRNTHNNRLIKQTRIYNPSQLQLFNWQ